MDDFLRNVNRIDEHAADAVTAIDQFGHRRRDVTVELVASELKEQALHGTVFQCPDRLSPEVRAEPHEEARGVRTNSKACRTIGLDTASCLSPEPEFRLLQECRPIRPRREGNTTGKSFRWSLIVTVDRSNHGNLADSALTSCGLVTRRAGLAARLPACL